jgi:hypothetical protein
MALKRLVDLNIEETSGVDHPAHLAEGWLVIKSAGGPLADAFDSVSATPTATEQPVELTPTEEVEAVVAEEVTEGADEATPVAASVDGPTDVQKELGDLRKELADAREFTKAIVEERELEKAAKSSHDWAILPGLNPSEFAPVLRALRASDPEAATAVEDIFAKSAKAFAEAGLLKELGSNDETTVSAWDRITRSAADMVEAGTAETMAKAISAVAEANTTLYSEYVAEQGA